MLGRRHARMTPITHDCFPHLRYSSVPLLERSRVAMWWRPLQCRLSLARPRPSLHPLAGSIFYSALLTLLLVLPVEDPFCESDDLTSLIISRLDNAHRRVRARLLIRCGGEVGQLRCGASRIQGLDERVVSQGRPLNGRDGRNIGGVGESDGVGHHH